MFSKKKKKKEPKVEKVFESSSAEEQASAVSEDSENAENQEKKRSDVDEFLGIEESNEEDDYLTEEQRAKVEKLNTVKSKISQILRSSNIEIIDENIGDEYEFDGSAGKEQKSQQDYDSLKAIFGDGSKDKKQELTLTIDDFDYTYVGQYLDEYDLMHMKNIKRIRLQKRYPKHLKKALIIAGVVVVAGLGAYLGYYFTKDVPVYLKSVSLSQTEHDYYINEVFDYTGLYFIAEYSDGSKKHIKLDSSYLKDITGRVERVGENLQDVQFVNGTMASLTFSYQGFNVDYTVNILKKTESGLMAIYANGLFNVESNGYIDSTILSLFIDYGNYGKQTLKLSSINITLYVDDVKCVYESNKGFRVESGTTNASVIKIEYKTDKNEVITLLVQYAEGQNVSYV